jgi:DNA-binding transcriptional LysR family regulator
MNTVHLRELDLNLLLVAEVIYRHRNLTAAAAELCLTPSAVSHALTRLTRYYGAPLFVRAARGVVLTELGVKLEPQIRAFRAAAQLALARGADFDPRQAQACIYIASTEFFELVAGHALMTELHAAAPGLKLCFVDLMGPFTFRALEMGQIDLVVAGHFQELPEGLSRRRLFHDEFATLAGGALPGDRPLTLEEYLQARHLLITLTGDLNGRVDVALRERGLSRQVVAATSSFTTPAWLLRAQDLVLTAPRSLLLRYQELVGRKAQPCPIALSGVDMQMIWHQRTHKDPLRQWVRERIVSHCRAL